MTLLLTEGFELPLATGNANRWNSTNPFSIQTDFVRTGTKVGYTSSSAPFTVHQLQASQEHATLIIGFAVYFVAGYTNGRMVRFLSDTMVTQHIDIMRTNDGGLAINRGATELVRTGANTMPLTTWMYVEVKVTLSDTVGNVEIRLNGATTPILTFTGDTKNGGTKTVFDSVELLASGNIVRLDDLYLLNGAGASQNNFLGEVRCYPLSPTGNGTYSQLVGSDGNSVDNYLLVDDGGANADYVGSATDGQKDTYSFTDVANVASVLNLYTIHWAQKSDSGPRSFRPVLRTNGSDHGASDYGSLSITLLSFLTMFNINPITGNPWTPAELNALEIGFEVRPG